MISFFAHYIFSSSVILVFLLLLWRVFALSRFLSLSCYRTLSLAAASFVYTARTIRNLDFSQIHFLFFRLFLNNIGFKLFVYPILCASFMNSIHYIFQIQTQARTQFAFNYVLSTIKFVSPSPRTYYTVTSKITNTSLTSFLIAPAFFPYLFCFHSEYFRCLTLCALQIFGMYKIWCSQFMDSIPFELQLISAFLPGTMEIWQI